MKQKNAFIWLLVFVFFSGLMGIIRTGYAETVKIGGSGFSLGVMGLLAGSFEKQFPGVEIQIFPSLGSSGGIKAVLQGALDLGVSARALNETEMSRGAIAREIARTPFVFFSNNGIDKEGLSFDEIAGIYAGEMLSWPDGTRIRLVMRPKGEGDMNILRKLSPRINQALTLSFNREGMRYAITDQENASAVERTVGAVGCGSLTQILAENRQVNVLSLQEVIPSVEGIRDGSYPWFKSLYLVTTAKTSPALQNFIEFIDSETGAMILNRYGNMVVRTPMENHP